MIYETFFQLKDNSLYFKMKHYNILPMTYVITKMILKITRMMLRITKELNWSI